MKINKYTNHNIIFVDPDSVFHDFIKAIKERDEKIKEEYEAFSIMHDTDGVFTVSIRSTEL